MAERTLRLIFENALNENKNVTISVPLSDDTKTGAAVRSAMDVIFTNKEIFSLDIGTPKAAAFVTPASLTYVDIDE